MTPAPTLYSIASGADGQLTATQVWQQDGDGPIPAGCPQVRPLQTGGATHLVCAAASGNSTLATVTAAAPWVTADSTQLEIGGPYDALEPFVLGNDPYLLGYGSESGELSVYPLGADLTAAKPYQFFRKRPPAPTAGFDMIVPVVVLGNVYFLGYAQKTGDVRAYSLSVLASTPPSVPGTPPLLITPVWDHQWAANWTRFAFFQLGGEVFFFKINVGKLNVNIDHLTDVPANGTVEVGSYLQDQLPDALQIDVAASFYLGGGDPHLLMYKTSGATDLYRVRGDCQGWTKLGSLETVAGASQVVPFTIGDQTFALFY
jgi:hypothetical protein